MDALSISGVFLKKRLAESEIRRLDQAIQEREGEVRTESGLANLTSMRMCRASLKDELRQRTPSRSPGGSLRFG